MAPCSNPSVQWGVQKTHCASELLVGIRICRGTTALDTPGRIARSQDQTRNGWLPRHRVSDYVITPWWPSGEMMPFHQNTNVYHTIYIICVCVSCCIPEFHYVQLDYVSLSHRLTILFVVVNRTSQSHVVSETASIFWAGKSVCDQRISSGWCENPAKTKERWTPCAAGSDLRVGSMRHSQERFFNRNDIYPVFI